MRRLGPSVSCRPLPCPLSHARAVGCKVGEGAGARGALGWLVHALPVRCCFAAVALPLCSASLLRLLLYPWLCLAPHVVVRCRAVSISVCCSRLRSCIRRHPEKQKNPRSRRLRGFRHTCCLFRGRSERIRTFDPLIPNQMRYQAALRSDESEILRGFWCQSQSRIASERKMLRHMRPMTSSTMTMISTTPSTPVGR